MADYGAPGTESPYESQQMQPSPNMTQQNSHGGYQQSRGGPQGNRPGDKIFRSKDENDETKLFVGGLNYSTDRDELEEYFMKFGELDDVVVKKDEGGKSRCFAFVKFKEAAAAKKVLSSADHVVDNKKIDCKIAQKQPKPDFLKVKKLFVGGLSNSTTESALKKYFSQFGTISHFEQPTEQSDSSKKRGFCFITFETEDAVNQAMTEQYHFIGDENARVEVKRAENKNQRQEGGGYGYQQQGQQRWGNQGGGNWGGDWSQGGYNQYDQNYQQYANYGQQYANQYPQYPNQYPNYGQYGQQPYQYDQQAYQNYYANYHNYGQAGSYDYSQQQQGGYPQAGYPSANENSQYGKAPNDSSGANQQYHPYSR